MNFDKCLIPDLDLFVLLIALRIWWDHESLLSKVIPSTVIVSLLLMIWLSMLISVSVFLFLEKTTNSVFGRFTKRPLSVNHFVVFEVAS